MIDSSTTPDQLAIMLGTNLAKLNYVAYVKGTSSQYETFTISKKTGGVRTIRAPKDGLKNLQRRLKDILEQLYKPHPAASAFISDRGIVYNASKHVRKAAVFNIDLEAFYDHIHFGRVMGLLMSKPYSLQKSTAQLIANLCCADKVIPQGAPTSPIISNMICRRLDRELSRLAKNNRAQYSRYADDITFSFRELNKSSIVTSSITGEKSASSDLVKTIERNGFAINTKKTRYQTYEERQIVTGLKVNNKVNIDRRYIRATRAMIHSLSNGIRHVNEKYQKPNRENVNESLALMVLGRLNFIGMVKGVESSVYQGLAMKFNSLGLGFNVNTTPREHGQERQEIPFFKDENRTHLEACVWVITFDGVDNIGEDEELMQGTAFMFEGQRIITASHVFEKAGYPSYCFLHKVSDKAAKYKAKLGMENKTADIAELYFEEKPSNSFNYLKPSKNKHINPGYEVAVVGFPQYLDSQRHVSIKACRIVNTFIKSTFDYKEIDVDIHAGNSGGPVVDGFLNVVGIAVLGLSVTEGSIEGTNAFVSITALDPVPPEGR